MQSCQVLLVSDDVTDTSELKAGLLDSGVEKVMISSIDDNVIKTIGDQTIDLIVMDVKSQPL